MPELKPFMNISPGDLIKEELEFYGWDQKDLADIINVSEKHLSKIINSKVNISNNTAKSLSSVFKQSPEFWLKADYDYYQHKKNSVEEKKRDDLIELKAMIYKYMPISQMQKLKWLSKWSNFDDLVKDICSFWRIDTLNFDFLENDDILCFHKKSDALNHNFNYYYSKVWLQKAKLMAENIILPKYDKNKLSAIFENLSNYTSKEDGITQIINDLKDAGVGFFILPHLQKTYLDGACFIQDDNPMLVYTGRYDRNDNFWFVVGHEIAHILYHLDKGVDAFLEENNGNEDISLNSLEIEANKYSQDKLKVNQILDYFSDDMKIDKANILACAEQLNIHPGIIVGFLQFNKKLSWATKLNQLKCKVVDGLTTSLLTN